MASSTAAAPPLLVLCLMLAASASANHPSAHKPEPGLGSETACAAQALSADDDVSLLQHRSLFGPLPTPRPQGTVGFEWWDGGVCLHKACLRAVVTATLSGSSYSMLLDSGSSTLALCNGTTWNGTPLPPKTPPPPGKPNGFDLCTMYGGSCPAHGFSGQGFEGELQLENLNAPTNYAVMKQKVGERGNACGIPPASAFKQGARRLEGIFGFAGSDLNVVCKGQYTKCDFSSETCNDHPCDGELEPQLAPLPALLATLTQDDRVWGLGWPSPGASPSRPLLGPGSGELLFGSAAKEKLQSFPAQGSVVGDLDVAAGSFYYIPNFGAKAFSVSGGVSKELPSQGEAPKLSTTFKHILDTGTPTIELPTDTFNALEKYFKESPEDAEAMVHIYVSSSQPLKLALSARVWKGGLFQAASSPLVILGLPLMMWYEYIQFDIQGKKMNFVLRPETESATFMKEVFKAAVAALGASP